MNSTNVNAPRPAEASERVSTLVGDRVCISCGYNLTGQPVLREPHYNLFVVRCPECGTVAATQEYPLLGRWAGRMAAVLAGLWFLIVVAMLFGTAGTQLGMAMAMASSASEPYSDAIWLVYDEAMAGPATAALPGPPAPGIPPAAQMAMGRFLSPNFDVWWGNLPADQKASILESAGGWGSIVNRWTIANLFPTVLISIIFGVVWSVIIVGRRRIGLLMVSLLPLGVLAALSVFPMVAFLATTPDSPGDQGMMELGMPVYLAACVFQWLVMVGAMMVGRPLVRWLLVQLLVPRLLVPLAVLWRADGMDLPTVRVKSANS